MTTSTVPETYGNAVIVHVMLDGAASEQCSRPNSSAR